MVPGVRVDDAVLRIDSAKLPCSVLAPAYAFPSLGFGDAVLGRLEYWRHCDEEKGVHDVGDVSDSAQG